MTGRDVRLCKKEKEKEKCKIKMIAHDLCA
jgi:hypothetical protein